MAARNKESYSQVNRNLPPNADVKSRAVETTTKKIK